MFLSLIVLSVFGYSNSTLLVYLNKLFYPVKTIVFLSALCYFWGLHSNLMHSISIEPSLSVLVTFYTFPPFRSSLLPLLLNFLHFFLVFIFRFILATCITYPLPYFPTGLDPIHLPCSFLCSNILFILFLLALLLLPFCSLAPLHYSLPSFGNISYFPLYLDSFFSPFLYFSLTPSFPSASLTSFSFFLELHSRFYLFLTT